MLQFVKRSIILSSRTLKKERTLLKNGSAPKLWAWITMPPYQKAFLPFLITSKETMKRVSHFFLSLQLRVHFLEIKTL